ncbi:MAG: hypothetical protein QM642_12040 [Edaphocola sp.]
MFRSRPVFSITMGRSPSLARRASCTSLMAFTLSKINASWANTTSVSPATGVMARATALRSESARLMCLRNNTLEGISTSSVRCNCTASAKRCLSCGSGVFCTTVK